MGADTRDEQDSEQDGEQAGAHTGERDEERAERPGPRVGAVIDRLTASGVLGGGAGGRVAGVTALTGGTYNTLAAVELADGRRLVLKIPPPDGTPGLRYEQGLLHGEALFYDAAAAVGVPAPRVLHAQPEPGRDPGTGQDRGARPDSGPGPAGGPFVLMSRLPGGTWWSAAEGMDGRERDRLRESLGRMVARLHGVTGPGFGYPSQSTGATAARWSEAFAAMTAAVLDDAERYGSWLPRPAARIRAALTAAAPLLDEVSVPALVHFDLWPGNILLAGPAGQREISGLIDGERMFWGDPLADFASLSLFTADAERDPAFLAGYGAGGGRTVFDAAALRRTALYRCYLYLIMLVEVVPRGYGAEHIAWVREFTAPRIEAALDAAAG